MVTAMRANKSLTQQTILDASVKLFQKRGFGGLGMRQIADCLNIKAPSLYHHFSSKEDMAQKVLVYYRENQLKELQRIEASELSLEEKLHQYSELFAQMLEDDKRPCLYLIMVRESTFQSDACAIELKIFAEQNIVWLSNALNEKKTISADIVFASLEGIMALSLSDENPASSFRERTDKLLKFILS